MKLHSICHNCDPDSGGSPKCRLGILRDTSGARYATRVHVKGADGQEVVDKQRNDTESGPYEMFLVGEANGRQEDQLGIPFVGDAGDILSEFVTTAGFDLSKIYITNIVKCRPPFNRKPAAPEIKACRIHIDHEIRTYQPKVIMLLGNSALKLFNLDKVGSMASIHGKIYEKTFPGWDDGPTFKLIPTYHPAAFIHRPNPQLQRRVLDDYVFAKKVLESTGETPVKPYYEAPFTLIETVDGVKTMVEEIKKAGIFGFDTESPDLHFMRSPLIMVQFSLGVGQTWVLPFYRHDPDGVDFKLRPQWTAEEREQVITLLKEIFEDENIQKGAHNIKYDITVIKQWLGIDFKGPLWCTQNIRHLFNEYPPKGLEYLADMEFGVGDYSVKIRSIVGHGKKLNKTYDHIPDDIFHQYAATDAEMVARLLDIYLGKLNEKHNLLDLYLEEVLPAIQVLSKAEWVGNKINLDVVKELNVDIDAELIDLTSKCRSLSRPDFNPASPQQVAEVFVELGLENLIEKPEKATGYSTDKDTLQPLANKYPLARHVLKFRHLKKLKSTYLDNVDENLDEDGRLRFSFRIDGTVNGRLSCSFLHQIPNIDEDKLKQDKHVMRDIFCPESGYLYFYGDYSMIELRIFAILAKEEEYLKAFREGRDVHTQTAATMLGVAPDQISPYNRLNIGKRFNFGIIFGSQGYNISEGDYEDPSCPGRFIGLDFGTVQYFVQNYKRRYKKIDEYMDYIPDLARSQGGMLTSVFGRERHIPGLNEADRKRRNAAEREAVSFTVQGPAGAINVRTMNMIDDALVKHDVGLDKVRVLNNVHDSLAYEVKKLYIEWFQNVYKTIAEREVPQLENNRFPVKCGYSDASWTQAELNAA